jgi:hypothetical protein
MNAIILLAALSGVANAASESTNPIGKVIQMVSDLEVKVIGEGDKAQKVYSEFAEFCEDRSRSLGFAIKDGKAASAELNAVITEQSAFIDSTNDKIENLAASIAVDEADLKAASQIREKEAADFAAEEKELQETIDTLHRAVRIVSREMQKGGASMLQLRQATSFADALNVLVQASSLNNADASRLTALIQNSQSAENTDPGAPAGAVYESQSGNIVETLEGLQEEAEGQLDKARKEEVSSVHNFELLKQSLDDAIRNGNNDMSKAKKARGDSEEKKATAEGDLDVTTKTLKADEQTLADLHRDCMTKAQDFEAETKSRGEELKALAEAKKIIQDSTSGAEQISYGLVQTSFLQRAEISSTADLARFEAVRLVRELARQDNSRSLAQLAMRMVDVMQSSSDPFAKVKALISDMVARLEDEAQADATEKAFCDKELSETEEKKANKQDEIAKLSTQIDKQSSRSSQLKDQVAGLQKNLAELAAAQLQMDKIRAEEHTQFESNKADMEQGVAGVKLALKVLRDYYAGDKSHAAAEGAGAGIIGLLEVCESDFSKNLSEIISTEETAQADYDRETKENQVEKATKEQDVKYKTQESVSLDKATAEATSDRTGVQNELDAVLEYLSKLRARCVAKAETYSERKARREAEISGLKQALDILENQAALVQTGSTRSSLRRVHKH